MYDQTLTLVGVLLGDLPDYAVTHEQFIEQIREHAYIACSILHQGNANAMHSSIHQYYH